MDSIAPLQHPLIAPLRQLAQHKHTPRATYRVQFNADFTFEDARRIVPYLSSLGISDLYGSPILRPRPGSTHGYDICDYSQLNEALGTEEDFAALISTLHQHSMGFTLDIVPNHMSVDTRNNLWWRDVLENGPSSPYATFFDIDWRPVKAELANKVLLPILEDQYGAVLESGKIALAFIGGHFVVQYNGMDLPISPDSYDEILTDVIALIEADEDTAPEDPHLLELKSIQTALRYLPSFTDTQPQHTTERAREKEIIKRRLAALLEESSRIQHALSQTLHTLNGDPADRTSYDRLDQLLQRQPYRMASWRVAADEINYRRFFDINDMAAIRVEQPSVFEAVHEKVIELMAQGSVTGLRVDHPDGLWNPATYFQRLQEAYLAAVLTREHPDTPDIADMVSAWYQEQVDAGTPPQPVYVVAEKILSEAEPLPLDWAVNGTTGYDFLNAVNGLFIDTAHEAQMTAIYEGFVGQPMDFRELVYNAKHLIMDQSLASEIRSLSRQLERITEQSRRYRDFTLSGLTQAIREVIASLSIYRTYLTEQEIVSERDRYYVVKAVINARLRNPHLSPLLFTFMRDTLLLNNLEEFPAAAHDQVINFVMHFQQISGPVMAKSMEDTAFYNYHRMDSLNEVGGHPDQFGTTLEHFHQHNQFRQEHWPDAMLTTSTHDTKRSEDVRARISVLSELPDEWGQAVEAWAQQNRSKKTLVDELASPDANDEYLFYQTLLGIWQDNEPRDVLLERLKAYMTKATNEGKVHTSWINPNDAYNNALHQFIESVITDEQFIASFQPLANKSAYFGRLNALSQTLLKLTVPGVPDVYQGNELWDLSLVDPDNRRPVDFEHRQALLEAMLSKDTAFQGLGESVEQAIEDGRAKLMLTALALRYRRAHAALLAEGAYIPLEVTGQWSQHVCAFVRHSGDTCMLVAVPLRCVALTGGQQKLPLGSDVWGDTALVLPQEVAAMSFRDVFTRETIITPPTLPIATLFQNVPFALLATHI